MRKFMYVHVHKFVKSSTSKVLVQSTTKYAKECFFFLNRGVFWKCERESKWVGMVNRHKLFIVCIKVMLNIRFMLVRFKTTNGSNLNIVIGPSKFNSQITTKPNNKFVLIVWLDKRKTIHYTNIEQFLQIIFNRICNKTIFFRISSF